MAWPNPRFTHKGNGTVTHKLTELIWFKDADCAGGVANSKTAIDYAAVSFLKR